MECHDHQVPETCVQIRGGDELVTSGICCPVPPSHVTSIDTFSAMAITVSALSYSTITSSPAPKSLPHHPSIFILLLPQLIDFLFSLFSPPLLCPPSLSIISNTLPAVRSVALLSLCPVTGWIAASSSVPSVVTFSRTLMQWDITQLGSTRRATAKARTQPLRIYHPNKRPLPPGATQEYIKLQHNSRSLLQVLGPSTKALQ
ncbi:hypothetical protein PAMP_000169 [Pampus punctatissimus]